MPLAKGKGDYLNDPVAFAREVLELPIDEWQAQMLRALVNNPRGVGICVGRVGRTIDRWRFAKMAPVFAKWAKATESDDDISLKTGKGKR